MHLTQGMKNSFATCIAAIVRVLPGQLGIGKPGAPSLRGFLRKSLP
jgi:hypothetical protein